MMDALDEKLLAAFPGKVVRKDLVRPLKGQLNVPAYVLEYLLGKYCSSSDPQVVDAGLREVERILVENYVRPDRAEVLKSRIKTKSGYRVIDKIKVRLVETDDRYWADLVNLQLSFVNIRDELVGKYEKLLAGGIWAIIELTYDPEISFKGVTRPFTVEALRPIQLPVASLAEVKEKRSQFSTDEWINVLIRSVGFEPEYFNRRQKLLFLVRLLPLIENNYNLVELGPRGTGKSYVYRELTPYAILISGGETTVPSLFVSHIGRGHPGLVSLWDTIAFDEVAGLIKLKQSEAVQILKDYMESGSFSRGREETTALASMVFVGNIHHDIEHLVRTAHLFTPFPPEMQDLAFLDRFHLYLPGWEIPKVKPEFLTDHYGFVVDYLAEFLHSARQETFASAVDSNYRLGGALNERDRKAVRKTVSAILKLLHPDGNWNKGELEEYLRLAMEMRRRVKEQLKRMGGVEFWNTSLSYSPLSGGVEQVVNTPEIREGGMIASGEQPPGSVLAVGWDSVIGRAVLFRFEAQLLRGTGKLHLTGAVGRMMKEAAATAFDYLKSQAKDLVPERKFDDKDVHVQVIDLMRATEGRQTGLSFFVAILSAAANKRCIPDRVATGDVSIHGDALPLENLAECVLLARENGAKKLILPRQAKSIIHTVPEPILEGLTLSYCDNASQCFDLFLS